MHTFYVDAPDSRVPTSAPHRDRPQSHPSETTQIKSRGEIIPIFGTSLFHQLKEQGGDKIPQWLAELCTFLTEQLNSPSAWLGLNRSPVPHASIREVYTKLCSNQRVAWNSLELGLQFLQLTLERLPEPLLTLTLHMQWIGSMKDIWENEECRLKFVRLLVGVLPAVNRNVLQTLLPIFAKAPPETVPILSSIWGPTLLLRRGTHAFESTMPGATALFSFFVANISEIINVQPVVEAAHPPKWLLALNDNNKHLIRKVLDKERQVHKFFVEQVTNNPGKELQPEELFNGFGFMETHLHIVSNKIGSCMWQVLDVQHLNRFNRYLCDLDETMQSHVPPKNEGRNADQAKILRQQARLLLYFTNSRFRDRLFQLLVAMLRELRLFTDAVYELVRPTPDEVRALSKFTLDFFDEPGRTWWEKTFGYDRLIVGWNHFVEMFMQVSGKREIPPELIQRLKDLLDPNDTNFASAWRVGSFLFKFWRKQDLKLTFLSCLNTVAQDWFHPYISKEEIKILFDKLPLKYFVVRFRSKMPGAFAIHWKRSNGEEPQATAATLNPKDMKYHIFEHSGGPASTFDEMNSIVEFYRRPDKNILGLPFKDRIILQKNFYGFLDVDDTNYFLKEQGQGTYLIRFSYTFPDQLCVSYVASDTNPQRSRVEHVRIERNPVHGNVTYQNSTYDSVAHFLQDHDTNFRQPYKDSVSLQVEEEEQWRESFDVDQKTLSKELEILSPDNPPISPDLPPTQDLATLLQDATSATEALPPALQAHLVQSCFQLADEEWLKKQSDARDAYAKQMNRSEKINIVVAPWRLRERKIVENTLHKVSLTLTNGTTDQADGTIDYTVLQPSFLDRSYFFSVVQGANGSEPPTGKLAKNASVTLQIVIVMYQPCDLKRTISIRCTGASGRETLHIPFWASSSSESLTGEQPPKYWDIKREYLCGKEVMHNSSESDGKVSRYRLFGVDVVVKEWEYETKPPPPFHRELGIFLNIKHANLVTFVGAANDVADKWCMVAMEFCEYKSLDNFLEKFKPDKISDEERLVMALDICTVMHHIHSLNLIHRDLKAGNLLVDSSKRVKLADFGTARDLSLFLTYQAGTPNWMAPEVITSQSYTSKADVFPFALLLWQICEHKTPKRQLHEIQAGDCPSLDREWVHRLPVFSEIVDSCSHKNPAKRPSYLQLIHLLTKSLRTMREKSKSGSKKKKV